MSKQTWSAERLPRLSAFVVAATTLLILAELSTWASHDLAEVWVLRIVRVLFELGLAIALVSTLLKRERHSRSNLLSEVRKREFTEQQLLMAMDAARIGCWDWDVLKNKQVWSETCKALLGLPSQSEENFDVLMAAVHPDDRDKMRSAMNRAIQERRNYFCEFRVLWPDGSMHWQAARGLAFYDDEGRTTRMIGIAMDIDEQKSKEERLRLQSAALEAAANAIVITGADGNIRWVNRAFTELTGYSPDESIGQNPRMLKSGEHDQTFYRHLWATIQAGQVWRGEMRNRKKDGSLYSEEMTITPVRSPSGETTNFIAIKQDATERKKLEAQYRHAQRMEAVGRLAGGVAHDFNNILGVISGYSEISLDQLNPENAIAKNLRQIKAAADRAASLTRQLLAFSRQQVVYPRVVNLNAVVENMESMLQRLVGDDISITVKPGSLLGSIKADVGQLEQVVMNLAVNARDAMSDGGQVTIQTCNVELDQSYQREHEPVVPGRYVMLSMSDSGCGMDQATQARIFEPFYTTKEAGRGTGLGLSTVYGIVKQSGGYVWVYSEVGKGTTFKLYFPHVSEPAEALSPPTRRVAPGGGSETILLVEDDDALREFIAATLRGVGYTVLESSNAQMALKIMAKHEAGIHLLLTDVIMPGTSGVQLFTVLRASAPRLKVILMSGYAAETLARQGAIPQDVAFIEKPFSRDSLLLKIKSVLH
ncbi:MAG TPA: PAS domain S-box protein [Terriglobales bacterium]|nr:PAS domain S-box protein [Terriglobales bacterium]